MSGLFHSLLSKKHAEPECLTAQGIAARLERMFSEAASYIIIVSPYIKLNLRLRDILGEKKKPVSTSPLSTKAPSRPRTSRHVISSAAICMRPAS